MSFEYYELPDEIRSRVFGVPAFNWKDLIPKGFINIYDSLRNSSNDVLPNGEYSFQQFGTFIYATLNDADYTTNSYKFKLKTTVADLENGLLDSDTGKKERIFQVYIDYSYYASRSFENGQPQGVEGIFEVENTYSVALYKIHVFNEERFIPGPNTEFDIYVTAGQEAEFTFNPYYKGEINQAIFSYIIGVFADFRFSSSVVKLLPAISARFAHWYQGGVPLNTASDPGAVFDQIGLASGTLGAGAALTVGTAFGIFARLFSPVAYDPFRVKMAYHVVGESNTYFNEIIEVDRTYFTSNAIVGPRTDGSTAYLLNLKIGGDDEVVNGVFYISNVVPFPYSEDQKRNIGKGLVLENTLVGTAPIGNVEYFDPPRTHPLRYSVIKDKKITRTYTRQVDSNIDARAAGTRASGSVYSNMPEHLYPGGRCNVQVWINDTSGNFIQETFYNSSAKLRFYVTYQKASKHQLRQVNTLKIYAFSTTRLTTNLDFRSYSHSTYYAYDNFYVKKEILYDLYSELGDDQKENAKKGIIPSSPLVITLDEPPVFASSQDNFTEPFLGWPSLFDRNESYIDFRPIIKNIKDLLGGSASTNYRKASCYRMSQRKFQQGALDIFLPEGFFVCAARFALIGGEIVDGGIGYIDGLGQLTILLRGEEILDQEWWFNNFKSKNNTFGIFSYTEGSGIKRIVYDRSIYANSLLTDYEKIGYEYSFAEAIKEITPVSRGGSGIGICILDFIDTKRDIGSIRPEVSGAALSPSAAQSNSSLVYVDLSEAFFDDAIAPNVRPYISSISAPIINSADGRIISGGSMTGYNFCDDVSPVELSRSGRFFLEPTVGISFSVFGVRASDYMWIQSNSYDVKLGFASDYYKNLALYAKFDSERGNIRIYPVDTVSFLSYNMLENTRINRDQIETDVEQYKYNSLKWYGLPVDRLPFYQHGIEAIESENDKYVKVENLDSYINYRSVKGNYLFSSTSNVGSIDGDKVEGASTDYYGEGVILVDSLSKVSRVVMTCSLSKDIINLLKKEISKDPMVLSFSASFGESSSNNERSRLGSDAIVFASFSILSDFAIRAQFNVPNYSGNINLSGPIMQWINTYSLKKDVDLISYDAEEFNNFNFNASDVFPAIDGFTKGYVGCISNKDSSQSIDIYTTGDHDRRWRLFRNVFQSFTDDNIYGLVLKADSRGRTVHIMFSLNGILLIKSVDGYAISNLRYHNQPVVSSNIFLIGSGASRSSSSPSSVSAFTAANIYGLSPGIYDSIQNLQNEKKYEFDHLARLSSTHVVQALWFENQILKQEHINTLGCNAINQELINAKNEDRKVKDSIPFKGFNNSEFNVVIADDVKASTGISIYPRINVPNLITSQNEDVYWPVNQPYTFEVLSNGTLIAFVLKDGYIHIFNSGDGKSWSTTFGFYGYRPIKFSIYDQDSAILDRENNFVAGSCPPIENISSCYDSANKVLTLFYVINNIIFAQHFYDKQILSKETDGITRFLNTYNLNPLAIRSSRNRPFYIVGAMNQEMISAGKKGENYFGIGDRTDSQENGKNIIEFEKSVFEKGFGEATLNTPCNGKAPGATYIGPGLIRLYYEDDEGTIRGATINNSSVKLDVNRR